MPKTDHKRRWTSGLSEGWVCMRVGECKDARKPIHSDSSVHRCSTCGGPMKLARAADYREAS